MKRNQENLVLRLVKISLLGALYAGITLLLSPISFGPVQFRISEALTLLAVFSPWTTLGLTLGCFLSNLIGFFLGQTFVWDLILGPLATLLAGFLSYFFRKVRFRSLPILSAFMPALLNGLIIGTMLTFLMMATPNFSIWISMVCSVAAGELMICLLLGLPLCRTLEKTHLNQKLFDTSPIILSTTKPMKNKNNS